MYSGSYAQPNPTLSLPAPGQDPTTMVQYQYPLNNGYYSTLFQTRQYTPTCYFQQTNNSDVTKLFQEDGHIAKLFANDIESIRLFSDRMVFQSIFIATPLIPSKDVQGYFLREAVTLSDDGATLNFWSSNFFKKYGIKPIGIWLGLVKTIPHLEDIEAPIHRVDLKLNTSYGGK